MYLFGYYSVYIYIYIYIYIGIYGAEGLRAGYVGDYICDDYWGYSGV